jgi:hypothetical protein
MGAAAFSADTAPQVQAQYRSGSPDELFRKQLIKMNEDMLETCRQQRLRFSDSCRQSSSCPCQ